MTKKEYLEMNDRCELCGSPKRLELHHIIPLCAGGEDELDNWIAICSSCHSKLTPKSLLTKQGIDRTVIFDSLNSIYRDFYGRIGEILEDGSCPCGADFMDIFDEVYVKHCTKIYDRLKNSNWKEQDCIWINLRNKLGGETL